MGQIIGYIFASIIASIISGALLIGIPFGVLLEMKNLGTYLYALTIVIASFFELGWFLFMMFISGDVKFNIKDIPKYIKSIFKKEKNRSNNSKKTDKVKTSKEKTINIVEEIILIAIAVYSVINPQHSTVTNVIYNGLVIKILAGIFIPLIIINTINQIIMDGDGFFSGIGVQFSTLLGSVVFGFVISTGMLFVASIYYPDIETSIKKEWFIYDNPNFDEIRSSDTFNVNEYLKKEYKKLTEKYLESAKCDVNEENCMNEVKLKIVREIDNRNASIRTYGYMYKSKLKVDINTDVLCITDMKTTHNLFYQINYKDFSFKEITMDEYNSYANAK